MKVEHTERGFEIIRFIDTSGHPCSLQQCSGIGDYDDAFDRPGSSAIWIGSSDAKPIVMARHAARLGRPELLEGVEVFQGQPTGWVEWKLPEEVQMRTRANLNREQVKEVIAHLQAWLDTGSLKLSKPK